MLGAVFERFVEKSPISVMVRATLERVLSADRLDLWYERTAEKQYTRDLLFSTVYDLMSQVVFCVQPSVRAAYLAQEADVGTSIVSVYNKLNGLETRTSAELVRYSAREFAPLIAQMDGACPLARRLPGQNCRRQLSGSQRASAPSPARGPRAGLAREVACRL